MSLLPSLELQFILRYLILISLELFVILHYEIIFTFHNLRFIYFLTSFYWNLFRNALFSSIIVNKYFVYKAILFSQYHYFHKLFLVRYLFGTSLKWENFELFQKKITKKNLYKSFEVEKIQFVRHFVLRIVAFNLLDEVAILRLT